MQKKYRGGAPESESSEDSGSYSGDSHTSSYTGSDDSLIFHDDPDNEGGDFNMVLQGSPSSRPNHMLPIQFAKEHINKIEEDMKKMHDRHVRLMREMDENYKLIE